MLAAALVYAENAVAQAAPPPVPQTALAAETLTPAARAEIVAELSAKLRKQYVFPEVAQAVAVGLVAKLKRGGYDAAATPEAFAAALTTDLRALGKDSHLRVRFEPQFRGGPPPGSAPSPADVVEMRAAMEERGFGIERVQRLPGNIGYLDIRGFFPTEFAAPSIAAVMTLLNGTDALIIDLRRNGGGEPDTVAYLMSYLFAEGDARHLNDIYSRQDGTMRSYWTVPSVGARYTRPIYVLTSKNTFSGGEEFAYDVHRMPPGALRATRNFARTSLARRMSAIIRPHSCNAMRNGFCEFMS
jgi:hypothetical protein